MITYDPEQLHVQWDNHGAWNGLDVATVTIASGYDISENGVALFNPPTATVAMSFHGTTVTDPLALATRVRVIYTEDLVLFDGYVTDVTRVYTAQPLTIGLSASLTSPAGLLLAETVSWDTLPSESASVRIRTWFESVDMNGATNPLLPEEEAGSATKLDLLRAFSNSVGLPVYLDDDLNPVVFTTADTVPESVDEIDAANDLYSSVSHTASAGARILSSAPGDRTYKASAALLADRMDIPLSGYRVPQALPVAFGTPLRTVRWEMTYGTKHCAGTVEFDQPTVVVGRPRPPATPYMPGGGTTPLTGGKPWDDSTAYPPGSVVTYDGHMYRAPTGLPAGIVPGEIPPPQVHVLLPDTHFGTGALFTAIISAEILYGRADIFGPTYADGGIEYRVGPELGQTAGRGTAVYICVVTEDGTETPWEYFVDIHTGGGTFEGYFHPQAWNDTEGNDPYSSLIVRRSAGDEPAGTPANGPIVATYPFTETVPAWILML